MHESSMKQKVKNTIWVEHPKAVDLEACISKALKLQASQLGTNNSSSKPQEQPADGCEEHVRKVKLGLQTVTKNPTAKGLCFDSKRIRRFGGKEANRWPNFPPAFVY
ncbi:hypothetical protein L3X38_030431 [Prunus dulcis]|uniref:Uncharacterized protein n=1 Tax=Prunus dulcis TaxID=3755 RepID=A0AAD4VA83_PRUDU|nr:hypothetical protein L3X38_030431 [Prunus dulcis]